MIALGFLGAWFGYTELVYGWTLLKGYDVTWRQLADPIHPYQWASPMPTIGADSVLPGQAGATSAGTQTSPATTQPHALTQ